MERPEFRRNLAGKTGCRVIEQPETPEGYGVPLWCDEHDSEWPCPEYQRIEAAVETEVSYWRERAWDEGARHGVLSSAELARRNPYRNSDNDDLAEVRAEYWRQRSAEARAKYWRLHSGAWGPVVDNA